MSIGAQRDKKYKILITHCRELDIFLSCVKMRILQTGDLQQVFPGQKTPQICSLTASGIDDGATYNDREINRQTIVQNNLSHVAILSMMNKNNVLQSQVMRSTAHGSD